jgi:signal transduction histidine kinase
LVLRQLTDLMGEVRAILVLLDERKRELVSRSAGGPDDFPLRLPLGEGVLSRVVRTGKATCLAQGSQELKDAEWASLLSCVTTSAVATPLKNNLSRTIGVLLVINKRTEAGARSLDFDDEDEEILSVLAKQAAIAIDNSRLLVTLIRKNQQLQHAQEQLTRRVRDLELLFELERSTAHAQGHEDLAREVLERLARACNAGGALLVLADDEHEQFVDYCLTRSVRAQGQVGEGPARFSTGWSTAREGVLSSVIENATALQLDVTDAPLTLDGLPPVESIIAEPLSDGESPIGALALLNKRGGPFTAEDLGLLRLVSANVSTAVRLFNANQARQREERLSGIGRLMAQVVHDLKSPLTVISGYVQLMEVSSDEQERKDYAAQILKQFDALGAMQREVLAFARGETKVFARNVIIDRLLADVQNQMAAELVEKKAVLRVSAAKGLLAHLDSERITRALQNLIRNAAEAMEPLGGGSVTVRADVDGDAVTFRVSDTGPGIPAAIGPRLFRSFVTSGKLNGTGLGLAIVKRIVEEHGGSVELCSVPRGACFLITLPSALVQSQPDARPTNVESAPRQKVARVQRASATRSAKPPSAAQPSKKTKTVAGKKARSTPSSSSKNLVRGRGRAK